MVAVLYRRLRAPVERLLADPEGELERDVWRLGMLRPTRAAGRSTTRRSGSDGRGSGADDVYARPARSGIALEPSQLVLVGHGLAVNIDGRRQLKLELARVVEVSNSAS